MPDFDIRDFGAVGDDQKDDTAAIQRAIDRAAELPRPEGVSLSRGGARVIIPPGTYLISQPLILPAGRGGVAETGGAVHLIGHRDGSVIHGVDNGFPIRRGMIEFAVTPWLGAGAEPRLQMLGELAMKAQARVRLLLEAVGLGHAEFGIFLDPLPGPLLDPIDPVPDLAAFTSATVVAADFSGLNALMDGLSDWLALCRQLGATNSRHLGQRIEGLRLYMPQHSDCYAVNRPWPFPAFSPDALVYLRRYLDEWTRLHAAGQISVDPTPWRTRATQLAADWDEPAKLSGEISRVELQLERIQVQANDTSHPAVFRFDGSVYRSSFKHITVYASTNTGSKSRTLTVYPDREPGHGRTREYDTVAFLFEHRHRTTLSAGDSTGFQSGVIEDVGVAWSGGGHNCFLRGRVAGSQINRVFMNRALFGPSMHLIDASDSDFSQIHSEGTTDDPMILIEGSIGLRFTSFGIGTPSTPPTFILNAWPAKAVEAAKRISAGLVLRDTVDCEIFGRVLDPEQSAGGHSERVAVLRAGLPGYPKDVVPSTEFPPAFVRIEAGCRRNRVGQVVISLPPSAYDALEAARKDAVTGNVDRVSAVQQALGKFLRAEIDLQGPAATCNEVRGVLTIPTSSHQRSEAVRLVTNSADPVVAIPFVMGTLEQPFVVPSP